MQKKSTTKKENNASTPDELLPEYDFSQGVRGRYTERLKTGSNIIALDPDLLEAFPDSRSVNEALRLLMKIAAHTRPHSRKSSPRA